MHTVNWQNPYAQARGRWLKGNLHTHTAPASGCGRVTPADMLALYEQAGYDFLSLSDHMTIIDPPATRLTLLPGVEWNSDKGEHTGVYAANPAIPQRAIGFTDQQQMLSALEPEDALVILNHPNWQLVPHYRREDLQQRRHYDGIEIYNGVIERLDGFALATDKWDYLLVQGVRVLGFASDDAHIPEDVGLGWLMVQTADESPAGILGALQRGEFYGSSGVTIREVGRDGDTIFVESDNAEEIHAVSNGGAVCKRTREHRMSITFDEAGAYYIRFTLYGTGTAMAWTQPFFRG